MDDKNSASSVRRQIERTKKVEDAEFISQLKREEMKFYWEEVRSKVKGNIQEDFWVGAGSSVVFSLGLRSVAIFPLGMGLFFTFEGIRGWMSIPKPDFKFKD